MTSSQQTFVLPVARAADVLRGGRSRDGLDAPDRARRAVPPRRPRRLLRSLSLRCGALGGRVSLVKNVHVGDRALRAMYADGLVEYRALKSELDPAGLFTNGLLDRLLGDG